MPHSLLPGDHTPHSSGPGFLLFPVNGSKQVGGGRWEGAATDWAEREVSPGGSKFACKAEAHAHTYTLQNTA